MTASPPRPRQEAPLDHPEWQVRASERAFGGSPFHKVERLLSRDSLLAQQIAVSLRVQVDDGGVDGGIQGVLNARRQWRLPRHAPTPANQGNTESQPRFVG
jgi:hypothetical protein